MISGVTLSVDDARVLLADATATDSRRAADARAALEEAWPGVIELCSVDPGARVALSDLREPLAAVGEGHEGAYWIAMLLGVLHEAPFVAIEPETHTGIVGRMSGVVDNFQLHTLLMDDFPGEVPRVSPEAAMIARGRGPQASDETLVGAWNLYTFEALREGRLPDPEDLETSDAWIWNEGTPSDIPVLDSYRVVLLGPPGYRRTWTAQRTFPDLPATLEPKPLSVDEVHDWLSRIEAAAR
jgi:hypothetical protein